MGCETKRCGQIIAAAEKGVQQNATEKIAGLRQELAENGRTIEQADTISSELQLEVTA